jgi:hypothetical protein
MKDKLYLATVRVNVSRYMVDDGDEQFTKTHIVRAFSMDEAEAKVKFFYESKDDPYSISYRIDEFDISEEIS